MGRKPIALLLSASLIMVVWAIYMFLTPQSDMMNTVSIYVVDGSTGEAAEITDRKIIKRIVACIESEEEYVIYDEITEPWSYTLEFFTENTGYGPLLCFEKPGICIFERETRGRYIKVKPQFFDWIREGMDKGKNN